MADGNTTSYSLDKPTYAYTARTTEFDDALIRRGIVTLEQAMMGKGASAAEAKRLAAEARERAGRGQAGAATATATVTSMTATSGNKAEDGGSSDDEFLEEYRRTRLREMEEVAGGRRRSRRREGGHGDLVPISRPDWTREVNEASRGGRWVVVLLTLGGGGGGGGAVPPGCRRLPGRRGGGEGPGGGLSRGQVRLDPGPRRQRALAGGKSPHPLLLPERQAQGANGGDRRVRRPRHHRGQDRVEAGGAGGGGNRAGERSGAGNLPRGRRRRPSPRP